MSETGASKTLEQIVSAERFQPYLAGAGQDDELAKELYFWGAELAAAAFRVISIFEVGIRNAMDQALSECLNEERRGVPWFLQRFPNSGAVSQTIDTLRDRLAANHSNNRHQIMAGLSFGFWTGLLGPKYEELWRMGLSRAFPLSDGLRSHVSGPLNQVREFRNRVAHHDSLLQVDVPFEIDRMRRVAATVSPEFCEAVDRVDNVADVFDRRPVEGQEVVVVPASRALALYRQVGAYVCQAGRFFRPAQYIAFYANREISPDIARVQLRRDNVRWTEKEAGRLAASSNRDDQRIAKVIRASRERSWTEGVYQVFLLSRSGDPTHRRLDRAVPNTGTGRGSAFVRKQRYTSLRALEHATSTDDLT